MQRTQTKEGWLRERPPPSSFTQVLGDDSSVEASSASLEASDLRANVPIGMALRHSTCPPLSPPPRPAVINTHTVTGGGHILGLF